MDASDPQKRNRFIDEEDPVESPEPSPETVPPGSPLGADLGKILESESFEDPVEKFPVWVWVFAGVGAALMLVAFMTFIKGGLRRAPTGDVVAQSGPEMPDPLEVTWKIPEAVEEPDVPPVDETREEKESPAGTRVRPEELRDVSKPVVREPPSPPQPEPPPPPPKAQPSPDVPKLVLVERPSKSRSAKPRPAESKPEKKKRPVTGAKVTTGGFFRFLGDLFTLGPGRSSENIRVGRSFLLEDIGMEMIWVRPLKIWVARSEVTHEQFARGGGTGRSRFSGSGRAKDSVTWNQAMDFCRKLTESERKKGRLPEGYIYTLPTEAQWLVYVGNAGPEHSVYGGRNDDGPREPGTKPANNFGLVDVRGNLWEWMQDNYYRRSSYRKALRGGCYSSSEKLLMDRRGRYYGTRNNDYFLYGFRFVLTREDGS